MLLIPTVYLLYVYLADTYNEHKQRKAWVRVVRHGSRNN